MRRCSRRGLWWRRGPPAVPRWDPVHSVYQPHRERVSLTRHPRRVFDSTRQTSEDVARQVHAEVDALEALIATNGLPVKKKALAKVRTQLVGVSALVNFWWQGVWHDLQQVILTPRGTKWMAEGVLPLMDWRA